MTCARRLADARKPALSTSTGSPRKPEPRLGHRRARLSLLSALALLCGALSLFNAAPAQAQATVWSAGLTVGKAGNFLGFDGVVGGGSLSVPSFTYGGATYQVQILFHNNSVLRFGSYSAFPAGFSGAPLVLHLGTNQFRFADATLNSSAFYGDQLQWSNHGLSWSEGSTVSVSLVDPTAPYVPPPPPTVSLSAGPYSSVTEGSNFFVMATLSRRVPGGVRVPLTLTNHTAEAEDYQYRHDGDSGHINVGGLSMLGALWFRTNQDADGESEEFTVAIDTSNLPSSVTAGSPSSVRIRIDDDDASNKNKLSVGLSVTPNPVPEGGTVTVTASLEIGGRPTVSQNDEVIPLRVYGMTSEAGDHGTLGSIRIPRYRTSGAATIATRRDGDRDDERFAVQLGRLPPHLAAGRCWAVLVTVSEGGAGQVDPCTGRSVDAGLGDLGLRQ